MPAGQQRAVPFSTNSIQPDIERLRGQPPKIIPDYLTPMPSHLLTTVLSDLEFRGRVASHSETHSAVASESSSVIQRPALPLPQGHHLVYFPIQTAPSDLAPDGADLDHSPGPHYCRRLWAGGEVTFRSTSDQDGLVLNGQPWTCTETIDDVRVKGSGVPDGTEKVFVDVWRRYALGHASRNENLPWSIEERRTLAFMDPAAVPEPSKTSSPKMIKCELLYLTALGSCPNIPSSNHDQTARLDPHEASHSITMLPSPAHLFNFSALTFNAHAIHLDPEYARSVDGHRAPLVHGPLTLALMLHVLTSYSGQLVSHFVYRNHAPLYVNEPLTVKLRMVPQRRDGVVRAPIWDAWVEGPDGGLAVKGTATMSS